MNFPVPLRIILFVLLIGSWFLIGEKKSFGEKLGILLIVVALYIGYFLLTGRTVDDAFAPLLR